MVREELDEIFDYDRCCTEEDTRHMKYLELCIKESMRIYPPQPFFLRETIQPVNIGIQFLELARPWLLIDRILLILDFNLKNLIVP